MQRFFLHIRQGDVFIQDEEGSLFLDLASARAEALAAARELLAERIRANQVIDGQRFEITDDQGVLVATVNFRDAMRFLSD